MTRRTGAAARYTKERLAGSERYKESRDLLMALLKDGKQYTLQEADRILEKYMKGKVK